MEDGVSNIIPYVVDISAMAMERNLQVITEATTMINNLNNSSTRDGEDYSTKLKNPNDSDVLLLSLGIYAVLIAVIWLMFCVARMLFPGVYSVRNSVHRLQCNLAAEQYGAIGWMVRLFFITDDAVMDQCGLDPLCLTKILDMGFRVSMIGVFNMIWLVPLFATAEEQSDTMHIVDYYTTATIAHLPKNDLRLLAVTVASYFIFGFTMYVILDDIEWFTIMRYKWMAKRTPRNYAVYVGGIPEKYQSDHALKQFFNRCISQDDVLESHVRLILPHLEAAVEERKHTSAKLEHAINIYTIKDNIPTHTNEKGNLVNSIDEYCPKLILLNREVRYRTKIIKAQAKSPNGPGGRAKPPKQVIVADGGADTTDDIEVNQTDGAPSEGAFVTFSTLRSTQLAKQINLYHEPYTMKVKEAPEPHDIEWSNVGASQYQIQFGKLMAFFGTIALGILWTIPTVFAVALSSLQGLKQQYEWINNSLSDNSPWLETLLEQLAPVIIALLNAWILPFALRQFSKLECPISKATIEAMAFNKLSGFLIIQMFFVSAIMGGLLEELKLLVSFPTGSMFVDIMANTIPVKSSFFIQFVLVIVVLGLGLVELLGFKRIIPALLRQCVGPNLTEEEQHRKYGPFIRPFADPDYFNTAYVWAIVVLFMMILFVYASIAPLINFVLAFAFLLMGSGYRHQLVYVYPPHCRDTGGKLWVNFINVILLCMVLGEVSITILLAFKNGVISAPLMAPLIITTLMFSYYIKQDHLNKKRWGYLPANLCSDYDEINRNNDPTIKPDHGLFFINDIYDQPELRDGKHILIPDNVRKQMRDDMMEDIISGLPPMPNDDDIDEALERGLSHTDSNLALLNSYKPIGQSEGSSSEEDTAEDDSEGGGIKKHHRPLTPNQALQRDLPVDADVTLAVEVPCICFLSELAIGATKKLKVTIDDVEKVYTVEIKPGYEQGTKIKYREQDGGNFPAVTFVIQEEQHDVFVRHGNDLIMTKVIKEKQDHSCKIKVELLDGEIWQTKIPKNSPYLQEGKSLTVPNKGMPIKGGPERGNLIIKFVKEELYDEVETEEEQQDPLEDLFDVIQ